MKRLMLSLLATAGAPMVVDADETGPVHMVCTPPAAACSSIVRSPRDRFDPAAQQATVRRQLGSLPTGYRVLYFVVADVDDDELVEIQIRFLDELAERRAAREAEKTAPKE